MTISASKKRSPLGEITLNNNIQRDNNTKQFKKARNNEEVAHRKENSCLAYKSQFQAGVMETLAEEHRVFEDGHTLRLD